MLLQHLPYIVDMSLLQMVDRLDKGVIGPDLCPHEYKGLYKVWLDAVREWIVM